MSDVPTLTWRQLGQLRPCPEERRTVEQKLYELYGKSYKTLKLTLPHAAAAGISWNHLFWVVVRAAPGDLEVQRRLRSFTADVVCAVTNEPVALGAVTAVRRWAPTNESVTEMVDARMAVKDFEERVSRSWWLRHWALQRRWQLERVISMTKSLLGADAYAVVDGARRLVRQEQKSLFTAWVRELLIARFSADEPSDWTERLF